MLQPIVAIIVIFLLSLAGAFVLFKWLDASAVIKKQSWEARGSFAVFAVIFGMLSTAYIGYTRSAPISEVETWTIVGNVRLQDRANHGGIEVSIYPLQQDLARAGGDFRLHLERLEGTGWPELYIAAEGYYGEFVELKDNDFEVDSDRKRIRLKEPVLLERQAIEEGLAEEPYVPAAHLETGDVKSPKEGTKLASLFEQEVQ